MVRDAFEGVTEEEVNFTTQNNTLSVKSEGLWKPLWNDEKKIDYYQKMYAQHYSRVCFKTLKNAVCARRNEETKGNTRAFIIHLQCIFIDYR